MMLQLFLVFLVLGFTVVAFAAEAWLFVMDRQEAGVYREGRRSARASTEGRRAAWTEGDFGPIDRRASADRKRVTV